MLIKNNKKQRSYSFFNIFLIFLYISITLVILDGCSSTKTTEVQTAETIFKRAMEEFKDEDWEEASKLFDILKLQYPASSYADDAQFYIAEIHFKKKEYILSAFNYNLVRRLYPSSDFVKKSLYQAALSYYELSPSFDRDQEYTFKAIDAMQDYQTLYSGDSMYAQAGKYIDELRNKLARRNFSIAELYSKLDSYKSSVVYLDIVIDEYQDTKYYEPAVFSKVELLYKMKKYDECLGFIELYKKKLPNGENITSILDYEQKIKQP